MSSDLIILLAHRHQAEPSQVLLLSQLAYRRATLQPTVDKYATWWDLDRRCTDVSSSRIQLSKLQVHGLICTHVLSCCIPDAIYTSSNYLFLKSKIFALSITNNSIYIFGSQ